MVSSLKKKIMNFIKSNGDIDNNKLDVIEYGLDSLYLTFSKLIIVFVLSYILGIIKGTLLILLFYNVIRFFAFGMHAKKSSHCLIFSIVFFVLIPYIIPKIYISSITKIILCFISNIFIIIYAPADTEKRPLIKKNKRIRFKILSIIISFVYLSLIVYYRNYIISSYILFGLIIETIIILPITYKIFGLPYNNYKTFKEV